MGDQLHFNALYLEFHYSPCWCNGPNTFFHLVYIHLSVKTEMIYIKLLLFLRHFNVILLAIHSKKLTSLKAKACKNAVVKAC